ncbi:alpha-glucan family phosphorylase [Hydrogenobacter hydrogenophilus]|uniref:glycogen phosphorylase n=1 Tax=Hydrogenobacter hydrogenophilus TaxID=35835 RepID=A0A285NZF0_9AQUI|nr:alpha-glucan family phosphorylase [Hydrogenobacter hydrogenophilus]SNZ14313.1 starch phosphorylase [Hydrogenobacter hydrogenophilus]
MIAYFVMEVGLDENIPTYSGGLGTLIGDTLYSFADLGIPAVCITLLYKKGYVYQKIGKDGRQIDLEDEWDYSEVLKPLSVEVELPLGDRKQKLRAWEYMVKGKRNIKVIFLDGDIESNDQIVREAFQRLYYSDREKRLIQEIVLGIGGYRVLKALGYEISLYHINESHSAFLLFELLKDSKNAEEVRKKVVFTTHTSLPVGHDSFPLNMVKGYLKLYDGVEWEKEATDGNELDLSLLSARYSSIVNAVSLRHRFITKRSYHFREVDYITNGVYHKRWVCEELKDIYDRYLPGWDDNPALLKQAYDIPSIELLNAHLEAKEKLINFINKNYDASFIPECPVLCIARRITAYKRNNLILRDIERLIRIAERFGGLQVVFAGKAHPADEEGKAIVKDINDKINYTKSRTKDLRMVFIENYGIHVAKLLVSGCDVWLNNPKRPYEACGTSGMKASMNGVINFSTWDGWWLEGGIEGINGWGIGPKPHWLDMSESNDEEDLEDIYGKLQHLILPLYYNHQDEWVKMMKNSIATVGPYFNTYRMVSEYFVKIYSAGLRI